MALLNTSIIRNGEKISHLKQITSLIVHQGAWDEIGFLVQINRVILHFHLVLSQFRRDFKEWYESCLMGLFLGDFNSWHERYVYVGPVPE